MTKAKTPQIRFKGFTEAWEQRKLEEYLIVSNEKNNNNVYTKKDVLSVSGERGVVNQIEFKGRSFAGVSVSNYGILNTNDVVYTKSPLKANPYGIIKTNRDKAGIVSVLYAVFQAKENVIATFVQTYFEQDARLNNYLRILVNKGAKNTLNISDENSLQGFVKFPPQKEEQEKNVFLFDLLNALIIQQECKVEKLKTIKMAYLQKMFPQVGQQVPEIRFKGFTDNWEQRKLSVISNKVIEKNTLREFTETLTNSAEFGIISQRDFFDHDISNKANLNGYYIVANNDFVYNPRISTTAPVGPVNRNKLGRNGVMSPLYTVFRPNNVDFTYLEWFFKNGLWYAYMRFNGDSGARSDRFSIKDDVFFDMPISMPSLPEQKAIGELLNKLDNLITLHQRKLNMLKNIKKALLQSMFV